ncbi:hypothetical protein CU669_08545 [Paramagnetospirillum kuznetsovii]|uniref:Uncharacterized protein n=1 Tax=Paramagnetospirillum kuznetsovii TaxID=2053833 RepID=A0A364NZ34_9PROT|nr:hypothetical protein CU669_08545 [Paramagnetospirillum kuznetsovii]
MPDFIMCEFMLVVRRLICHAKLILFEIKMIFCMLNKLVKHQFDRIGIHSEFVKSFCHIG